MVLYCGHGEENSPHTRRVALMLSKEPRGALIGWESHTFRNIQASVKTSKEGITMNVIQCYASINDGNEDDKDQFYEGLHSVITKCPGKEPDHPDRRPKHQSQNGLLREYEDIMRRHGLTGRKE
ncbi:unnamed protein product [Schistosoma mattheei]|uniref:Uncharacterized protein n=1 Tax=Schistosoma mattheei TaxID=31246 RepID=A0A183PX02_9TREM|nr:unnamed protein product [Schistosoma mattheei]